MLQPTQPFGKRNRPADPYGPPACDAPALRRDIKSTDPGIVSERFLEFTARLAEDRKVNESESVHETVIVPKSGRAALLAGLVAACVHASFSLGTTIAVGQHLGAINVAGHTVPIAAVLLVDSLWSAARGSVLGLFVVRMVLGRLKITHFGAYALSGGLVALLFGTITLALGLGDLGGVSSDCATGLAAGFFYRLFAGTKAT